MAYQQIEVFIEIESMRGLVHFGENSPEELEKGNQRYMENQFWEFM